MLAAGSCHRMTLRCNETPVCAIEDTSANYGIGSQPAHSRNQILSYTTIGHRPFTCPKPIPTLVLPVSAAPVAPSLQSRQQLLQVAVSSCHTRFAVARILAKLPIAIHSTVPLDEDAEVAERALRP